MIWIMDSEGFIQPIYFAIISILILLFTYKKHTKFVWLSLIPLIALMFYQQHIEEVLIERKQITFAEHTWIERYKPLYIKVNASKKQLTKSHNEFELETEGGKYILLFEKEKTNGFEVFETIWESETLTGRENTLKMMELLELDGTIRYHQKEKGYSLVANDEEYFIQLNENYRVEEITDKDNHVVFENEERNNLKNGYSEPSMKAGRENAQQTDVEIDYENKLK